MSTDVIEREVSITAPIERVWSLVTKAEHLGTWFGEAGANVDLRPGGRIEVRWDGHGLDGVVAAVEPTSRFAFWWRQVDVADGIELGTGNSTLVEFTLSADDGGTVVRLVESGFDALELPVGDRADMHAAHTGGWEREIGELATYASGVAV